MLTGPERDRAWLEAAVQAALSESPNGSHPHVHLLGFSDTSREAVSEEAGPVEAGRGVAISLTPAEVFVGPVARSGGPCARCFALRWQKLRSAELRDVLETDREVHAVGPNPHLTPFLVEAIAALCDQLAFPAAENEQVSVYEIELGTLRVHRHELLADPSCPRCSTASKPGPSVVELRSRPKPAADADRLAPASNVLRMRSALVNPACGMLGRTVRPDRSHTTTAPATGHFLVRDARDLFPVHWSGHGDSYADSAAFALCEGVERYAGLACGDVATAVHGCYADLADRAVDPQLFGLYDEDSQHSTQEVFVPYRPDLPIHWVWGYSLTEERPVLLPKQLAYYRTDDSDAVFVKESSNGCASGSCLEEAILHGIFEVVERDAFLLAWYAAAALPEIDPDTCDDAATRCLLERVRRRGYEVRIFDARIDLDIPVVVAVARHRDRTRLGALSISAAANLDPERATASALREVASSVADLADRTAAELDRIRAMAQDFSKVTGLADHAALFGLPEMARHADFLLASEQRRPIDEVYADWQATRPRNPDLTDDVRFCLDHLAASGFDVIAVDQTTLEGELLGINTVRVLVPGLIPIDFGWSKQRALRMPRIFEVFRKAGWRGTDLDPSELHRVPHPFM
jgi:ribosomal protein S12 methylthiotransferase accessory factor